MTAVLNNLEMLEPTDELLAELADVSNRFETATPIEILRWAVERFGAGLTMATALRLPGVARISAGRPGAAGC